MYSPQESESMFIAAFSSFVSKVEANQMFNYRMDKQTVVHYTTDYIIQ